MKLASVIFFSALCLAASARAEFQLELPVDCSKASICYVQNYVDHDPGPKFSDYRCGLLGYDGHTGSDIAIANGADMRKGIPVLAAAPGRVRALRDGMADIHMGQADPESLKDRALGNAVVLEHADGWQTRYGHLRRGSLRVRPGQDLPAGAVIGEIGLSGRTEFPHLHFEVRRHDKVIDPFLGPRASSGDCGVSAEPLWSRRAAAALAYRPFGIIDGGFATETPVKERAENGDYAATTFGEDAEILVFWYRAFGLGPGETRRLRLIGPGGVVLAEGGQQPVERPKAQWFEFTGIRSKNGSFPPGAYRGEIRIERQGADNSAPAVELVRTIVRR